MMSSQTQSTPDPTPHVAGHDARPALPRFAGARLRRLDTNIATLRAQIEERRARLASSATSIGSARRLDRAEQSMRRRDLDGGWAFLHVAERAEIPSYSDDEFTALVALLRKETVEKLSAWRHEAASELLGPGGDGLPSRANVQEAMRVLHEHSDNQYHKLQLLRSQLRALALILALTLVTLEFITGVTGLTIGLLGWRDLLIIMNVGAIGGALSGARSLAGRSERRIPEWLFDWPITVLRPLLGAAAATGLALIVQAGVVHFGDGSRVALLATAFLAGFSERWFLGVIASAGAEEKGQEKELLSSKALAAASIPLGA